MDGRLAPEEVPVAVSQQLTVRHLRAFVALAEELHFGRAAASLHLTSSALSQTLRQLEVAVGTTLVRRTTRAVELTPAGRAALEHAQAALIAFDSAVARMQRAGRGEVGDLAVGYVIGAGLELMPAVIRAFERSTPDLRLDLREYDFTYPAAGLDVGEVDVAFVRPPLDLPGLEYLDLLEEPRVACVPTGHRLARRKQVRVREVLGEPIVAAPSVDRVWRDYWILVPERGDEPPNVVLDAPTFEAELQAVGAGRGISVTGLTAARYYGRPGVTFVPISDLAPCRIALAWWPDRVWGGVERLLAIAREEKAAYERSTMTAARSAIR
jgi:DNA-binding transcriptional LysR family regulator